MKKITYLLFLLMFVLSTPVLAKEADSGNHPYDPVVIHAEKGMSGFASNEEIDVFADIIDLPQSLRWPLENASYYEKYTQELELYNWLGSYYRDSAYYFDGQGIQFKVIIPNLDSEFVIELDEFRYDKYADKIFYYHGSKVKEISLEELEIVKKMWARDIVEGAVYLFEEVTPDLRTKIVANVEKKLKEFDVLLENESLEEKWTKTEAPFGADDLMLVPKEIKISDCLAQKFMILPIFAGPGSVVFGFTYPDTDIIFLHPISLILKQLRLGDTSVHEMYHNIYQLQNFVFNGFFNVESWPMPAIERYNRASDFLFHAYYAPMRKIAKVVMGFDADNLRGSMFRLAGRNHVFGKKQRFNEVHQAAEKVAEEIQKMMKDELLFEFYGPNIVSSALAADEMMDQDASVKTFAYATREFTLLGQPKTPEYPGDNSQEAAERTYAWLERNKDVIKEVYKTSLEKVKKEKKESEKKYSSEEINLNDYSDEDIEKIQEYLGINDEIIEACADVLMLNLDQQQKKKIILSMIMTRVIFVDYVRFDQPKFKGVLK